MIRYDEHGCMIITIAKEDQIGIELPAITDEDLDDVYNFQIEEVFYKAVQYKFPIWSHLIDMSYDGKDLTIEFTDMWDADKKLVIDFIEETVKQLKK